MKKLSLILAVLTVVLLGLLAVPTFALTQATPITIETTTNILQGIGATNNINTFCANGRHWIIYTNVGSDIVYRSATEEDPDVWTAETIIAADTVGYGPELSIWFDDYSNNIHYARHDFVNKLTKYRMGTPGTNGTITWAAAEQTVHATPSNLVTFRISMCTDTDGYPWVAWVDNDAAVDNTTGILYVESSSTKDGTWTEWAYENITTVGYHTWFVQLTPLSEAPYPRVEVEYSIEKLEDPNQHACALMASDESDNFTATYAIAALGTMNHTRPDAFGFNSLGSSSVYGVFSDNDGDIMSRGRSSAQTWSEATAAEQIVNDVGSTGPWRPSIVNNGGPYEDHFCIFSDNHGIYQLAYDADAFGWDAMPSLIYYNGMATINRHTTSYECYESAGVPLGLAFQNTEPSDDDNIYYWWLSDGTWGYYEGTATEAAVFDLAMILPYVFVAIALVAIIGVGLSGAALSIDGVIMLLIAIVVTIVGAGVILSALNAW